jgi:hypothetical protein
VATLSVVVTDVTLTLTPLGTLLTADVISPNAPRMVPIDWAVPPGLTLTALG